MGESEMAEVRDITASVVLLGRFNPLIFHPTWLAQQKIIGEQEASSALEQAGLKFMVPDIVALELSGKKVVVETTRFVVTAYEEPLIQARDLAAAAFSILSHTPCFALGINYDLVFRAPSAEKWHKLGDMLAPKKPWCEFLGDVKDDNRTGGLRQLVMERNPRPDSRPGYLRLTVEALDNPNFETKITVNDHYALGNADDPQHAKDAVELLDTNWEDSLARAQKAANALIEITNDD